MVRIEVTFAPHHLWGSTGNVQQPCWLLPKMQETLGHVCLCQCRMAIGNLF